MRRISLEYFGLLFPSPVVLVTCVDLNGKPNIITLGWTMKTSHIPPMVAISIAPSRYSHYLIEQTGEFVLAIPTMDIIEKVHKCGRVSGREIDKFKEFNLTPIPASRVKPPLIKECVANLECVVVNKLKTGDHTIFVGEVVEAHVNDEFYDEEHHCLDLNKAKTIISHGREYRIVGDVIAYKLNGDISLIVK